MHRSASVREAPTRTGGASPSGLARTHEGLLQDIEESSNGSRRDRTARHTLQPEYVPPQTHTARGQSSRSAAVSTSRSRDDDTGRGPVSSLPPSLSKPLPQEPPTEAGQRRHQAPEKMPPPVRPARDIPRSVSDSTTAFGGNYNANQGSQYVTRPSTQGSLTSASGPANTKSDLRLPSRGSYGQPVAPTVAATNVQGRVTQPSKSTRGYNISGPLPQTDAQNSIGQPMTTPMPPPTSPQVQKVAHHRRSSTLSGLGERLFGRSNSVANKDAERQKSGRKYPPTSMREYPSDGQPRMSTDSKRSFSFGLGKKRSTDLDNQMTEKPVRRFSLLPNSISFKGLMGGPKDETSSKPGTPQGDRYAPQGDSRPATGQEHGGREPSAIDGQYDDTNPGHYSSYSRAPQSQQQAQKGLPTQQASNDVYGGTGVYAPSSQGRMPHQRQQSEQMGSLASQYPNTGDNSSRPSIQQGRHGRGVLVKNNRKFTDAYDYDQGPGHHGGRSGAVKKVQDFFRRRRAPTDGAYR